MECLERIDHLERVCCGQLTRSSVYRSFTRRVWIDELTVTRGRLEEYVETIGVTTARLKSAEVAEAAAEVRVFFSCLLSMTRVSASVRWMTDCFESRQGTAPQQCDQCVSVVARLSLR